MLVWYFIGSPKYSRFDGWTPKITIGIPQVKLTSRPVPPLSLRRKCSRTRSICRPKLPDIIISYFSSASGNSLIPTQHWSIQSMLKHRWFCTQVEVFFKDWPGDILKINVNAKCSPRRPRRSDHHAAGPDRAPARGLVQRTSSSEDPFWK